MPSLRVLLSTTASGYVHNEPDLTSVIREDIIQGRFSVSVEQTLAERGLNLITATSGCQLAAWVFQDGPTKFIACYPTRGNNVQYWNYHESQRLDPNTVHQVQPYDTVYVNLKGLPAFVETILPNITTPVVMLVGEYDYSTIHKIHADTEQTLLDSSFVARLFVQNIDHHLHQFTHPKVAPWPFGLQPASYVPKQPSPLKFYRTAFLKYLNSTSNHKTKGIMHGYINPHTNPNRKKIPSGPKLSHTEYYDEMAQHRFILSPNGDRPECYRTYEALGLGTVPITELRAGIYRHLQRGPVLYENSDWNLTETEAMDRLGTAQFPTMNRMMVLEEYWLDYVQREVGRNDLRWFDRLAMRRAKLDDFQVLGQTTLDPV